MEFYLNETSLHQQFSSIYDFKKAILTLNSIFSEIDQTKKHETFYQDGWLFQVDYQAIKSEVFQVSFNKINPQLQLEFKRFLKENLKAKDWRREKLHDSENDIFECPILDDIVNDTTLAEVVERNLQNSDIQRIVINFLNSKFQEITEIVVFKNDEKQENPILLSCLERKEELKKWFDKAIEDKEAYLKNTALFRIMGSECIVQGRRIY